MIAKRCQRPSMRADWRSAAVRGGRFSSSPATQPTAGSSKGRSISVSHSGTTTQSPSRKGDDLAARRLDPAVARIGDTALGLIQIGDLARVDLGGGVVGRAVVDDEDLAVLRRVVAVEQRVDADADRLLAVATGTTTEILGARGTGARLMRRALVSRRVGRADSRARGRGARCAPARLRRGRRRGRPRR